MSWSGVALQGAAVLSPSTGTQCASATAHSPEQGCSPPALGPQSASSWTQSWGARRVQLGCSRGGGTASLEVLGGDDTPASIEASGLRYPSLAQGQRWAWGHSWEGRGRLGPQRAEAATREDLSLLWLTSPL